MLIVPGHGLGCPPSHFYEDFGFSTLHFFHGNLVPQQRSLCVSKPDKCVSTGFSAALKTDPAKGQSALTPRKAKNAQPAQHLQHVTNPPILLLRTVLQVAFWQLVREQGV